MNHTRDKCLYKGKVVYRSVNIWPDDLRALERISARLEKLYNKAQIIHTGDINEFKAINKRLKKLIKEYNSAFEAHSADFNFKMNTKDTKALLKTIFGTMNKKEAKRAENGIKKLRQNMKLRA